MFSCRQWRCRLQNSVRIGKMKSITSRLKDDLRYKIVWFQYAHYTITVDVFATQLYFMADHALMAKLRNVKNSPRIK